MVRYAALRGDAYRRREPAAVAVLALPPQSRFSCLQRCPAPDWLAASAPAGPQPTPPQHSSSMLPPLRSLTHCVPPAASNTSMRRYMTMPQPVKPATKMEATRPRERG